MKQNTPIQIRVVANGYVVSESVGQHLQSKESVFTDAASLGAFVARFYAENHAIEADRVPANPPLQSDIAHNPDNLTDEQVGVADGWRLLRKSELSGFTPTGAEVQFKLGYRQRDKWERIIFSPLVDDDFTYRTRVPLGQLS